MADTNITSTTTPSSTMAAVSRPARAAARRQSYVDLDGNAVMEGEGAQDGDDADEEDANDKNHADTGAPDPTDAPIARVTKRKRSNVAVIKDAENDSGQESDDERDVNNSDEEPFTYRHRGSTYEVTANTPRIYIDAEIERRRKLAKSVSKRNKKVDAAKSSNGGGKRDQMQKDKTSLQPANSSTATKASHTQGVKAATGPGSVATSVPNAIGVPVKVTSEFFVDLSIEPGKRPDEPAPPRGPALRMVHSGDLSHDEEGLRFEALLGDRIRGSLDSGMFIKTESGVHAFGGMVAKVSVASSNRNVMLCDTRKCRTCDTTANNNAVSPTNGLPFVHRRDCIIANSGLLQFDPEDPAEHVPCQPGQQVKIQDLIIEITGVGLRSYACAVCDMDECADCQLRQNY